MHKYYLFGKKTHLAMFITSMFFFCFTCNVISRDDLENIYKLFVLLNKKFKK